MAALFKLPVFISEPNWSERVDIEGQFYTLSFRWSPRARYWHVSLLDEQGLVSFRDGQRLVPIVGGADADELLAQLAEEDVARGEPAGTTARRLCLFPGQFPGLFWAFSGAPLRRTIEDLTSIEILYLDAEALALVYGAVAAGVA